MNITASTPQFHLWKIVKSFLIFSSVFRRQQPKNELNRVRHLLSSVDIPCPATSHPPICVACMSSQHANPVDTISVCPHHFIWSHFSCVKVQQALCVIVCVSEWMKAHGAWWEEMVGSRKLAKRSKVRGESRMIGLCCGCHSVATLLPGIWC